MGSPFDEVIGPDVIGPARPQPHAPAVVQPQAATLWMFGWDFQPLSPPDPLHPLGVHRPACATQEGGDAPVAVPAIGLGQLDDVGGERGLVVGSAWQLALGGAVLTEDLTGPALGHAKLGLHLLHTRTAASGA